MEWILSGIRLSMEELEDAEPEPSDTGPAQALEEATGQVPAGVPDDGDKGAATEAPSTA